MPKTNIQSRFFRVAIDADKTNGDTFVVVPNGAANPADIEVNRNPHRLKLKYRGEEVWQKQLPSSFGAGLDVPEFEYLIHNFEEQDQQIVMVKNTGNRSTDRLP